MGPGCGGALGSAPGTTCTESCPVPTPAKTLLERNRELESNIKHHQAVIDDQAQEIEYLSKQTAALREVNDSRLRIYEQLEISIQELEKNNQRLTAESSADKRKIKGICQQLESLEAK